MNKKNLSIFISVLITSIFFTIVFYWGYSNQKLNYESFRQSSYSDAYIEGIYTKKDIDKLKDIDNIEYIGGESIEIDSAKINDNIIVINYQDESINKMKGKSNLLEGNFPTKDDEIVLSEYVMDENGLKIGDKIDLDVGKRTIDNKDIDPLSTFTNKEKFITNYKKTYKIVGIYDNVYNKFRKINYALSYPSKDSKYIIHIRFDSFKDAYNNKENIEKSISKMLNKDIKLKFIKSAIVYYGVEQSNIQTILGKAITVLSVIGLVILFVFFVKNIFMVWAIRKIREISIYKSIGSTDFQIYKLLLKDGISLSIIPIVIGHIIGFSLLAFLYQKVQDIGGTKYVTKLEFSPVFSLIIVLVSVFIVMLSIMSPARKISKINIIDGIRGNFNFYNSKKRKSDDLWKELTLNNLASIKSQRHISSIGIIIISVFIILISSSKYYRDYNYFDNGYNIEVEYNTKNKDIPKVLEEIKEEVPNDKSYIFATKYFDLENNIEFSDEFIKSKVDKKLEDTLDTYDEDNLSARIIALSDDDLENIGGEKGKISLLNIVTDDKETPISNSNYIKYFKNPKKLNIILDEKHKSTIEISNTILDNGIYKTRISSFEVIMYTDFDTFNKFVDNKKPIYYNLDLNAKDKDLESVKEYITSKIESSVSFDEEYSVETMDDVNKARATDIESLEYVVLTIAIVIFILNVTNGYSSINLSLISRRNEIGTLYSCGMDKQEIYSKYNRQFLIEEIKSFFIAVIFTIIVMLIISVFSFQLDMKILLSYFFYKEFILFSIVIYTINIFIYNYSLKRMLENPAIDLIRSI